jgi:hypothetical protein
MIHGKLASVTDMALLGGANIFTIETPDGWEVLQAGTAALVAPGRYSLTRLLRGQFGTEDAMVTSLAAGARFPVASVRRDQPSPMSSVADAQKATSEPWASAARLKGRPLAAAMPPAPISFINLRRSILLANGPRLSVVFMFYPHLLELRVVTSVTSLFLRSRSRRSRAR